MLFPCTGELWSGTPKFHKNPTRSIPEAERMNWLEEFLNSPGSLDGSKSHTFREAPADVSPRNWLLQD